jgi:glycogen debranching enzyme
MIVLLMLAYHYISFSQSQNINIALLSDNSSSKTNEEEKAVMQFLKSHKNYSTSYLNFSDLNRKSISLNKFNMIWFLKTDSSEFSNDEINKTTETLKNYIKNGGKLILTNESMNYITYLGLEKEKPQIKYITTNNNGSISNLGFHSFRNHIIFQNLNGGAYIFSPKEEKSCRQIGYFDKFVPQKGKVIAVDWADGELKPDSKIVIEWELGSGKVIAIGSYMYFSESNVNFHNLKIFTDNIISYLNGGKNDSPSYYWNYHDPKIIPFFQESPKVQLSISENWGNNSDTLTIYEKTASDNVWDLSGQRMTLLGKEKKGIDEILAYPFVPLQNIETGIQIEGVDTINWLDNTKPEIIIKPESVQRIYQFDKGLLKELITLDLVKAIAVIHIEWQGKNPVNIYLKFLSNFQLLPPYQEKALGSLYYNFDKGINATVIKDNSSDFVCIIGSNLIPSEHYEGQNRNFIKIGNDIIPQFTNEYIVGGIFKFDFNKNQNIDIIIAASSDGFESCSRSYKEAMEIPESIYLKSGEYYQNLLEQSIKITSPDNVFNESYIWSLIALDKLYINSPGIGKSLLSGFSSIYNNDNSLKYIARETLWSGFSLTDIGDFDKVRSILDFCRQFQDVRGKIYGEISPAGFVDYNSSDASPLYIALCGKYLRHSGDIGYIKQNWKSIKKAIDYHFSTNSGKEHLPRNTYQGCGWISSGKLSETKTDIYSISSWAAALDEAVYMAHWLDRDDIAINYQIEFDTVKSILNNKFWNNENIYLNYGIMPNNSSLNELSSIVSVPLSFNLIDEDKASIILKKLADNNFSMDWGIRFLPENSQYDNTDYNCIYPALTGWSSIASFSYMNYIQGFSYLMENLQLNNEWSKGNIPAKLSAINYEPVGRCMHKGISEALTLQSAIEGMLGLDISALDNEVRISPSFPANWDSVNVEGIKVGSHTLDFALLRSKDRMKLSFNHHGWDSLKLEFNLMLPAAMELYFPDRPNIKGLNYSLKYLANGSLLQLTFKIKNEINFELEYSNGICILPLIYKPKKGNFSEGFRVLDSKFEENVYQINLQGKTGASESFDVYINNRIIDKIENAKLISSKNQIFTFQTDFDRSQQTYINKIVKIHLR